MNWRHVLQQTLYREVRVTAPSPNTPLSAMPQDTARTLPAPYSPWANQLMPPEQHFGDHPPHFPSMPMFWVQEQRRAHDGSPQQNNSHCAKIGLKMTLNPALGVRLLVSRPHHPHTRAYKSQEESTIQTQVFGPRTGLEVLTLDQS